MLCYRSFFHETKRNVFFALRSTKEREEVPERPIDHVGGGVAEERQQGVLDAQITGVDQSDDDISESDLFEYNIDTNVPDDASEDESFVPDDDDNDEMLDADSDNEDDTVPPGEADINPEMAANETIANEEDDVINPFTRTSSGRVSGPYDYAEKFPKLMTESSETLSAPESGAPSADVGDAGKEVQEGNSNNSRPLTKSREVSSAQTPAPGLSIGHVGGFLEGQQGGNDSKPVTKSTGVSSAQASGCSIDHVETVEQEQEQQGITDSEQVAESTKISYAPPSGCTIDQVGSAVERQQGIIIDSGLVLKEFTENLMEQASGCSIGHVDSFVDGHEGNYETRPITESTEIFADTITTGHEDPAKYNDVATAVLASSKTESSDWKSAIGSVKTSSAPLRSLPSTAAMEPPSNIDPLIDQEEAPPEDALAAFELSQYPTKESTEEQNTVIGDNIQPESKKKDKEDAAKSHLVAPAESVSLMTGLSGMYNAEKDKRLLSRGNENGETRKGLHKNEQVVEETVGRINSPLMLQIDQSIESKVQVSKIEKASNSTAESANQSKDLPESELSPSPTAKSLIEVTRHIVVTQSPEVLETDQSIQSKDIDTKLEEASSVPTNTKQIHVSSYPSPTVNSPIGSKQSPEVMKNGQSIQSKGIGTKLEKASNASTNTQQALVSSSSSSTGNSPIDSSRKNVDTPQNEASSTQGSKDLSEPVVSSPCPTAKMSIDTVRQHIDTPSPKDEENVRKRKSDKKDDDCEYTEGQSIPRLRKKTKVNAEAESLSSSRRKRQRTTNSTPPLRSTRKRTTTDRWTGTIDTSTKATPKKWDCEHCNKSFDSYKGLQLHISRFCQNDSPIKPAPNKIADAEKMVNKWDCEHCGKTYDSYQGLQIHIGRYCLFDEKDKSNDNSSDIKNCLTDVPSPYPCGTRMKKFFDEHSSWYKGTIVAYDKRSHFYHIKYEDGDEEDLEHNEFEIVSDKNEARPIVPPPDNAYKIGTRTKKFFEDHKSAWYEATIVGYNRKTRLYKVQYDDGDCEDLEHIEINAEPFPVEPKYKIGMKIEQFFLSKDTGKEIGWLNGEIVSRFFHAPTGKNNCNNSEWVYGVEYADKDTEDLDEKQIKKILERMKYHRIVDNAAEDGTDLDNEDESDEESSDDVEHAEQRLVTESESTNEETPLKSLKSISDPGEPALRKTIPHWTGKVGTLSK